MNNVVNNTLYTFLVLIITISLAGCYIDIPMGISDLKSSETETQALHELQESSLSNLPEDSTFISTDSWSRFTEKAIPKLIKKGTPRDEKFIPWSPGRYYEKEGELERVKVFTNKYNYKRPYYNMCGKPYIWWNNDIKSEWDDSVPLSKHTGWGVSNGEYTVGVRSFGLFEVSPLVCWNSLTGKTLWSTTGSIIEKSASHIDSIQIASNGVLFVSNHFENRCIRQFDVWTGESDWVLGLKSGVKHGNIFINIYRYFTAHNYLWLVVRTSDYNVEEGEKHITVYKAYRINPITGNILQINIDNLDNVMKIDGDVWLVSDGRSTLTKIDPDTGTTIKTVKVKDYNENRQISELSIGSNVYTSSEELEYWHFPSGVFNINNPEVFYDMSEYNYELDTKYGAGIGHFQMSIGHIIYIPEFVYGYEDNYIRGLNPNTGKETWRIDKNDFDPEIRNGIFHIDERGVVMYEGNTLYLYR
jgi:hypothetical protein